MVTTQITPKQLKTLERQGERYKSIIRKFINRLPSNARSVTGLGKWFNISRSNSQRVLQVLTSSDGLEVIQLMPSPQGLHKFVRAVIEKDPETPHLIQLNQMIGQFEALLIDFGISHNQLKVQLKEDKAFNRTLEPDENNSKRKTIFELNSQLIDESVTLNLGIDCSVINDSIPDYLSEVVLASRRGLKFGSRARPYIQPFVGNERNYQLNQPKLIRSEQLQHSAEKTSRQFLLTDYSSPNIESCFRGLGPDGNKIIYDIKEMSQGQHLLDITLSHIDPISEPNPLSQQHDITIHGVECRNPSQKIVLISLLDKRLATNSIAKAGNYTTSYTAQESGFFPEEIWSDRFSNNIQLEIFNPGETDLATKLQIPELNLLLNATARANNRNLSDLVGYYIVVDYPLWFTTYRIYFEYG
ncbi:hypothetical protein [Aliikangiella coralliicola]|uniref:Uncharacterized protein n=1 Tax=Aliikangiella coralliicola TaxID=2592383 RepID=A0A545U646_9GAMM|nr:hypothetical protein [Aliikangiella coralliicola]TQV84950.1 hypothetical protein FLL46_21390 [Aliikangiella coralliicola]